jgi:hypothetical protein
MAGTSTPIFPQTVKNWVAQILPADTTSLKTLVTGAANGSKVEMLNIASTDTSSRDVQLWLTISSVNYLLATLPIPANSGNTNALLAQGLLASLVGTSPYLPFFQFPLDVNGNRYLYVANGAVLSVACLTTVTAAKVLHFVAQGGDF